MTYIKNYQELNTSKKREQILQMIEVGLRAVSPETLLCRAVKYNDDFNSVIVHNDAFDMLSGRIFVIGAGKASGRMAETIEKIVGVENITAGVVNTSEGKYNTEKIIINKAGHPLPDKDGVDGVREILALKEKYSINKKDLVINLLSGGASAMMVLPKEGISLADKQKTTQVLIECGANIQEINVVRRHISGVKGGQLAKYFEPAKVLSLIISDVTGNDVGVIGSGPTVADESNYDDAIGIVERHKIEKKIPKAVIKCLNEGANNIVADTPKKLDNAYNYIIGKSSSALEAMALEARNMNLKPLIVSISAVGEPAALVSSLKKKILAGEYEGLDVLLLSGELTSRLPEKYGKGGRSQHFVALNMLDLEFGEKEWAMASVSSDGRDYLEGVAGAIIDQNSKQQFQAVLDIEKYIHDFDTNGMFEKVLGSLIEMDATGTNVGDLILYVL